MDKRHSTGSQACIQILKKFKHKEKSQRKRFGPMNDKIPQAATKEYMQHPEILLKD
jgi:hypothetical protein